MGKRYAVKVKDGAQGERYDVKTGRVEPFSITHAISGGIAFGPDPVELEEGPVLDLIKSNQLLEITPATARK